MYKRFCINQAITGNVLFIDGEEHNHLCNVLRLKIGDKIIVTCGDDYDYLCEIMDIAKKETKCEVKEKIINCYNPNKIIDVCHALIKNDKMSLVVQKLNEIGVSNLILFETKNQTVKPSENKKDKLQKISDQSTKQCKRSKSMKVANVIKFSEMLKQLSNYDLVIFANECEGSNHVSSLIDIIKAKEHICIVIGSEGGFTNEEIELILSNNAISVTLGKRILRAETASISLASFVSLLTNN